VILATGTLCALLGAISLVACFVRADSQRIEARLAGNEEKISKFRSLQGAWGRLGKTRRFFVSSLNYLIMAAGLLVLWRDKEIRDYRALLGSSFVVRCEFDMPGSDNAICRYCP
jgi:hypothetical protein